MEQNGRDYFENYEMHQFFYDVYSNARSGVLKIYFPESVVKTVYFSEGNIVYASSNSEKDKLITILIKYKKLTQEQLDAALRQMDKNISLGRNLVNMGFITHKELIWAVKVQVISIIHSIIVLKQGDFLFNEGPLPDGVINLPLNTMKVIFDSIIMFQDREWIAEKIQQPDTIYKKTLLFEEGKNRLITNPDLLEVAEAIDGKRPLSELTGMTTLEDFKVFKLLYALKFLTLIEEKMPEATLPASDDIFEIQDEPDEDLELAEEAFVQLGTSAEQPQQKEEPTVQLEKDQLPFHETEENPSDLEEPTERIDISDKFEPEVEFSEPESTAISSQEPNKDVFVEFKLQEDELSYEEESAEEDLQSGNALEFESNAGDTDDESERTELREGDGGFALTEQDIDSVIMDQDGESPEVEDETLRLERLEEDGLHGFGMEENDDATLIESGLSDSESFEEEVIDASAGGSGKWLLVTLITISVILFAGTMYYYQFWLPQQQQTPPLPPEKAQIEQAAPKEDVTATPITSLEQTETAVPIASPSTETNPVPVKGTDSKKESTEKNQKSQPELVELKGKETEKQISPKMIEKQEKPTVRENEKTVKKMTKPSATPAAQPKVNMLKKPTETNTTTLNTHPKKNQFPAVNEAQKATKTDKSILTQFASSVARTRKVFTSSSSQAVTLQLEVACKGETVQQALHLLKSQGELFLVPFQYAGSDCVIVCFGIFDSNQEAMNAMNNLPQLFYEDNNEPFVASVSRLKRRFQ
ncbi:MAG: hypothetical protein DRJ14_02050 [Acidobacteria bacterium]|nr:MAG: hypothetical protein DRJ14_02050 [Acidobacteriota bacterium]